MSASSIIHFGGLSAVWKRQLGTMLGNPLGYFYILFFVAASAALLFWPDSWYARNIADLGWLTGVMGVGVMPPLLVLLLPVLAMNAWALERELGTEELLLTLPLSITDVILGKYLAVVTYFTIALGFSLANVALLAWYGQPDLGQIFAVYVGWWIAGCGFAALGLLASTLVSMPAIAFVIGLIFSATLLVGAWYADWFSPFNRGLVPSSRIFSGLAVILSSLSLAALVLASRRWRPTSSGEVVSQLVSLVLGVILLVNVAQIANKHAVDVDTSADGLSSLGGASRTILGNLKDPVTITVFVSRNLPTDLQAKGKEIEDKLAAVQRLSGGKVTINLRKPLNAVDKEGLAASKEFGLKPRKMVREYAVGNEFDEIFLSAVVTSGPRTQTIEHFEPGLSVEYELVRAVRGVSDTNKKRVIGVAETDVKPFGDFDMRTYRQIPGWQILDDLKRQYEVRPVQLGSAVAAEIEVLVVPQPSSLTQPELENLHDYIWNGRPALLLEDALPLFSAFSGREDLIPNRPKKSNNPNQNPYSQQDPNTPKKGDFKPLMRALGLVYEPEELVWSDFNPSSEFRGNFAELNLVWVYDDQNCFNHGKDAAGNQLWATAGIGAALFPSPSNFVQANPLPEGLTVTPLIKVSPKAKWGRSALSEMVKPGMMGGVQIERPDLAISGLPDLAPMIAAQIRGTMRSVYARSAPEPETKDDKAKDTKKDDKADPTKPGEVKKDQKSAKPVNVIVIGDVDFCANEMWGIYQGQIGGAAQRDKFRFLLDLRNVQLFANAIDALANDPTYIEVRTRRPPRRPLVRDEAVVLESLNAVRGKIQSAQADMKKANDDAEKDYKNELKRIEDDSSLDDIAKAQRKATVEQGLINIRDRKTDEAKLRFEQAMAVVKSERDERIERNRSTLKIIAVAIPAGFLAILAVFVLINRLAGERSHIPNSRKRSNA